MARLASMIRTLGLAALLPAASGCGDSRASTSSGEPKAAVDVRGDEAHMGGGGAVAIDRAEGSANRSSQPAPAAVGPEPLVGGYDSMDALGRAVVDALVTEDPVAAQAVVVDVAEWKSRLFAALVNHPSALKLGPDLAWANMSGESHGDMKRAIERLGGKRWRFVRIDAPTTKDRGELVTYLEPVLVVADQEGREHDLAILGPIVEHRASGTFKLLSYRD